MHKNVAVLVVLLVASSTAFGWLSTVPGTTHEVMADRVLADATVAAYVSSLGLSASSIADYANTEPPSQYSGWSEIRDKEFETWGLSNQMAGYVIHAASDSGVPVSHSPANAVWSNDWAETIIEVRAAVESVPALSSLYTGTYSQKTTAFYNQVVANANGYKYWYDHTRWYKRKSSSVPSSYYHTGESSGMRMSQAALLEYFDHYSAAPVPEPATMALLAIGGVALIRRRRK